MTRSLRPTIAVALSYVAVIALASQSDAWRLGGAIIVLGFGIYAALVLAVPSVPVSPPCVQTLEGDHAWGPWSRPYVVRGRPSMYQERRCQCGNRDFRVAPATLGSSVFMRISE